jgi:hypothetical protein
MSLKIENIQSMALRVSGEIEGVSINALVKTDANNGVQSIEDGHLTEDGAEIATFYLYGKYPNVNFQTDDYQKVTSAISEFKTEAAELVSNVNLSSDED